MTINWVTTLFVVIVGGSMFYGFIRGFGYESRMVISLCTSIVSGIAAIAIGWFVSHRVSAFVLHQDTSTLPHWLAQVFVAWQKQPRIGMWVAFIICYLVLSSILHRLLATILFMIPRLLPGPLERSRILGGALGAVLGGARSVVIGGAMFLALQYFTVPALAKQANQSAPYNSLAKHIYTPWLKPFVAQTLPVLAQGALKPIAANISLFAVPTGPNGQEQGALVIPKQIADLSHQLTKGMTDPRAKAKALYEWEIHHITYDWKKYDDYVYHHKWDGQSPLQTLKTGKGVCADYALLYADLAHAAGLKVKIDEGIGGTAQDYGSHAWNEVWLPNDKRWALIDTTWGATQDAWFDVPPKRFWQTHQEQDSIVIDASTTSNG